MGQMGGDSKRCRRGIALVANKGVGTRVPSCNWANMGKLSEMMLLGVQCLQIRA